VLDPDGNNIEVVDTTGTVRLGADDARRLTITMC
jgi:hypothetical protein